MIASASAEDYGRAIETVAADPEVDAMIVIYIPPQATKAPEIGRAIVEAVNAVGGRIPVATTWMSAKGLPDELEHAGRRIPSLRVPRAGRDRDGPCLPVRPLARTTSEGRPAVRREVRTDEAVAIVADALGRKVEAGSRPTRSSDSSRATGSGRRGPNAPAPRRTRPKRRRGSAVRSR